MLYTAYVDIIYMYNVYIYLSGKAININDNLAIDLQISFCERDRRRSNDRDLFIHILPYRFSISFLKRSNFLSFRTDEKFVEKKKKKFLR